MDLGQLPRVLTILGVIFLVLAGGLYLCDRFHVPLGKLPGDLLATNGNLTCAFPLVT